LFVLLLIVFVHNFVDVNVMESFLPRNAAMLSVCLSDSRACFVTKPNNALRMFWYQTKGQPL